jgi:nicotinamide mononucleotide adenylyltransferase
MKKCKFTGEWSLFIGRWQVPERLHEGHIQLIRTVLNEGGKVCIGIRDTKIDKKNPYTIEQRKKLFYKEFSHEIITNRMKLVVLPDIKEVCHGRKVGWGVREIRLNKKIENISATEIRKKDNK